MSWIKSIWDAWSRLVKAFGTVLMFLALTIIYWVVITIMWIPMRFVSDPLALRDRDRGWVVVDQQPRDMSWMRRQG